VFKTEWNCMDVESFAREARTHIIRTISGAGLGHVGGDLSVIDILSVLYVDVLRIDPEHPEWSERDRFVLSKGHAAVSFYTVLAMRGFFDLGELGTFAQANSRLNGHPARTKVPGVETSTGPLGHGLPAAVGMAVGARITGAEWRTFVITGDGELQEGSNWEAALFAAHRRLGNLTCVIDRNRLQQGAGTEATNALDPLDEKFRAFGWDVAEVDGHDIDTLRQVLTSEHERPLAVIANTTKGKGVSFMEGQAAWHHKVPTAEQAEAAIAEIEGAA
jgi:transketolase